MAETSLSYDLHRDELVASVPKYRDLTLDLLRPTGDQPVPVVGLTIVEGADHCFGGVDLDPLVSHAISFFEQKLRAGKEDR